MKIQYFTNMKDETEYFLVDDGYVLDLTSGKKSKVDQNQLQSLKALFWFWGTYKIKGEK